ncbi:MAG TPA: hypothetical protein VGK87_04650 [Anaerolineae bacterium]
MGIRRRRYVFAAIALPLVLAACAPEPGKVRIELPQQYRQPQASLVTTFERRSGRIALIDENGNLVVMDQTGGGIVKITKDAADNSTTATNQSTSAARSKVTNGYHWPVWSPDASQIAFVEVLAERSGMTRIIEYGANAVAIERGSDSVTIQQDENGQALQRSPNTTSVLRAPSRIIIESDTGGSILSSSIFTARADGKSPLQEVYAAEQLAIGYVDWSPDNSQLAFLAQSGSSEVALQLVGKDAGKPRKLVTGANATWQWNPDGKTLVAKVDSASNDNTADLALLDTHADQTISTITKQADIPFGSPAFSPDGNAMLVTAKVDGQQYLALADNHGKIQRNLSPINGNVRFSWSPVSAKVAYIVLQSTATDAMGSMPAGVLHLLNVNSGEDKVLSQMPVAALFWSPDGERVAAFSPARVSDIRKDFPGVDLTSSQPSSVLMLQTIDINSRAFRQLFYIEPTTDFAHMLSQFDRFSRSMNIWSPDSHSLVFPVVYSNNTTSYNLIVETEASGSIEPRVISQGTLASWSPK